MTKTMANPCQSVKLLHSRRGRVVALGECVGAVLSPFHRQDTDIPMANLVDLEHNGTLFRRGEACLHTTSVCVSATVVIMMLSP